MAAALRSRNVELTEEIAKKFIEGEFQGDGATCTLSQQEQQKQFEVDVNGVEPQYLSHMVGGAA